MGGMVGKFMKSFGLTMAFAVMVSLLVSFTLTPMLGARWLRKTGNGNGKPRHLSRDARFFRPIDHGYTAVLGWALTHRGVVAAIALLVLLSSVPLAMIAPKNFMPIDDQSEFEVGIRAPEGTSLQATELVANRVAATIRQRVPEAEYTLVTVADDSAGTSNAANIYIRLSPIEARDRDQFAIMADVRVERASRVSREPSADHGAPVGRHGRRRGAELGDSVRPQRPQTSPPSATPPRRWPRRRGRFRVSWTWTRP